MRVQCQKCQAPYNIPDEKVQARLLRFTCKRCGTVIHVRREDAAAPAVKETAPPDARPAPEESAAPALPAAPAPKAAARPRMTLEGKPLDQLPVQGQAVWYLAYSKNKRGPMTVEQVREHLSGVSVQGEIYVWKAGFENWKRLAEVPEFAAPQPAPPAEEKKPADVKKPAAPRPPSATGARPAVPPAKAAAKTEGPSATDPGFGKTASRPRPTFTELISSELGQPRDQPAATGAFKLDLDALVKKETVSGAPALTAAKAAPQAVQMEEYVPPRKKKIPYVQIGILVFLFCLAFGTPVGLAYYQVIEIQGLDKVPGIGKYFKKEEVDRYAQLRDQWEMLVKIDDAKVALQATKEEEERAKLEEERQRALEEKRAREQRALERRQELLARNGGGGGGGGGGGAKGRTGGSSFAMEEMDFGAGNEQMDTTGDLSTVAVDRKKLLDQGQINAAIRASMGRIAQCAAAQKKYGALSGQMEMRFMVSRRGSVVGASVTTPKFKGSYVADCVAATIESTRFPLSGASVTASYTFTIQ